MQVIPPYNGFGILEDSLQNCFSLLPKPPRKDVIKMLENDHKVLRYQMVLVSVFLEGIVASLCCRVRRMRGTACSDKAVSKFFSVLLGKESSPSQHQCPSGDAAELLCACCDN